MTAPIHVNSRLKRRFEEKVSKKSLAECWEWTANVDDDGYGRIKIDGYQRFAHRVSYSLYVGQIPHGMLVLHRCDNPPCVNPHHLWCGTHADNTADKCTKGRQATAIGEASASAKLTADIIPLIRNDPRPQTVIADRYGVDQALISRIKSRKIWRHVP